VLVTIFVTVEPHCHRFPAPKPRGAAEALYGFLCAGRHSLKYTVRDGRLAGGSGCELPGRIQRDALMLVGHEGARPCRRKPIANVILRGAHRCFSPHHLMDEAGLASGSLGFDLDNTAYALTPRPLIFVCRCFRGRGFARVRPPSYCTRCWIVTVQPPKKPHQTKSEESCVCAWPFETKLGKLDV
jgi:hypothetical protein